MKTLDDATAYHAYEVPRADRTALIDPPLGAAGTLFSDNVAAASVWDVTFGGMAIADVRREARRDLLDAALRHSRPYRDYHGALNPDRILLAGHQPHLFHPGVWFKNFALSRLAHDLQASAINLIVDNDLLGPAAVRLPSRHSDGSVSSRNVALDQANAAVPAELQRVRHRSLFDSFDERVADTMAPWVDDPCVQAMWPAARAAADRCSNLGCAVATARHWLEASVGLETMEVPLSSTCRTRSFAAFVVALIQDLPRLHECYNRAVIEYRMAHGIRSQAHPVPMLGEEEGWLEAPLWVFSARYPERRGLWVRSCGARLELSDRRHLHASIELRPDDPAMVEALLAIQSADWQIRPRALTTTMYARMVLSDLFLHGIGGGKYDQLGDTILQRFFGVRPPHFMVLSATVQLPGIEHEDLARKRQRLTERLRATHFNPQRFAGEVALPASLLSERLERLEQIPPRGQKRAWHDAMERNRQALAAALAPVRERLGTELQQLAERTRRQQILTSRELPFCVYRLDDLNTAFDGLLTL